jgi:hypothetical protein
MTALQITTSNDVYQLVERLKIACQQNGATELFNRLDDAMNLGSSALEILGAIRQTFINNRSEVERLLGRNGKEEVDSVIAFVDKAYGR